MSESVEIVLEAIDKATPVFKDVETASERYYKKTVSILEEQIIRLTQGATAAEKFKLAAMGMTQAEIEHILQLRESIAAEKERYAIAEKALMQWRARRDAIEEHKKAQEDYIEGLYEELVALDMGTAAVEQYRLTKRNFSKEVRDQVLEMRKLIEAKRSEAIATEQAKQADFLANAQKKLLGKSTAELAKSVAGLIGSLGAGPVAQFATSLGIANKKMTELNANTNATAASTALMKGAILLSIAEGFMPLAESIARTITGYNTLIREMQAFEQQQNKQNQRNIQMLERHTAEQIKIAELSTSESEKKKILEAQLEKITSQLEQQEKFSAAARKDADHAAGVFAHSLRVGEVKQNQLEQEAQRQQAITDSLVRQRDEIYKAIQGKSDELKIAERLYAIEQEKETNRKKADEELLRMRKELAKLEDPEGFARQEALRPFREIGVKTSKLREAEELQDQIEAQKLKKTIQDLYNEALEESAKINQKNADEQEKQAQKEKDYLDALRLKNIELMNGAEAMHAEKEAMMGLTEEAKAQAAHLREQNQRLEERKKIQEEAQKITEDFYKKLAEGSPELQVKESRLLTRAGGGTPNERIAKASEEQLKIANEVWTQLSQSLPFLTTIADNTKSKIKVIK